MSRSCSISTKPMCAATREQRDEFATLGRRQAGGRLVEQDQARRTGERHADLELALLAVRQGSDRRVADGFEPHALERRSVARCDASVARGRRKLKRPLATPRTARKRLSRTDRFAKQQRGLVGATQALPDPLVRRQLGDVLAEEMDAPGGRRKVAGDCVEEGRLAGAVGAENRAPFARGDRKLMSSMARNAPNGRVTPRARARRRTAAARPHEPGGARRRSRGRSRATYRRHCAVLPPALLWAIGHVARGAHLLEVGRSVRASA